MKCSRSLLLVSALLCLPAAASPADAKKIQGGYQLAMEKWTLEMQAANTPATRTEVLARRPDATPYARDMWINISRELDQDWTLEPTAWFLRTTPGLLTRDETGTARPIFSKETEAIRKAIETYHINSKKLVPICEAMAAAPDPKSAALLEKIQEKNPDPEIQGVAAITAAIQLKSLGDNPDIMRKRLTYITKAIKQSAHVDFNGTSVAKLAEDELYIIRFLTKGRVAPDLVGTDSAGRAISLSAQKGKVIVLLFWNSNVPDAKRVVEITTAMERKLQGQPFAVMGVNNDTKEKLRTLQADGTVPWTNFSDPENKLAQIYRVGSWPLAYVLDGERKIQYASAPGSFVELTAEALLADKKKAAAPQTPPRSTPPGGR